MRTSKEVVADAQFVINQRGIGYKNFIPATFGSQAARKFSAAIEGHDQTDRPRPKKFAQCSGCV